MMLTGYHFYKTNDKNKGKSSHQNISQNVNTFFYYSLISFTSETNGYKTALVFGNRSVTIPKNQHNYYVIY